MHYSYQPLSDGGYAIVQDFNTGKPRVAWAYVQCQHGRIQQIVEALSAHDELLALLDAVEAMQYQNAREIENILSAADAARSALKLAKY